MMAILATAALSPTLAHARDGGNGAEAARETSWQQLARHDARLLRLGDRIARASAPLCPNRYSLGFSIGNVADIDANQAAEARAAYDNSNGSVFVTAIAAGGAADAAGLRIGDAIASIGGVRVDTLPTQEIWEAMGAASVLPGIDVGLADGSRVELIAVPACPLLFVVDTADDLNAGSDGTRIRVTRSLMDFAADDAELAAVIAHEAGHFALCHQNREQSKRKREEAADRLSARILTAAGFDLDGATRFWSRFGARRGLLDAFDFTHGSAKKRIRRIAEESALVTAGSGEPFDDGIAVASCFTT